MARVLVVEDEMLVSMMLEDLLSELGYHVVGPAVSLAEALQMASAEQFDLAILDVNLRGCFSHPVAELLQQKGVPFVFATGYGLSGVPARFSAVPVLQKPVDRTQLRNALLTISCA